jgi:hypothetical protein
MDDDGLQFDMFGPGARAGDPRTSQDAAAAHPVVRGADRRLALQMHFGHPYGLTDFELADLMERQQTSAGKRRGELRDLGLIADSGLTRAAPSGSQAIVWRITEAGVAVASG